MTSIGDSIKSLRIQNDMSQERLAEVLNISRQAISNWENGKTQPDAGTLLKLASIFNVSVDDILHHKLDGKKPGKSYSWIIAVLSLVISGLHFILAMRNFISPVAVMISPGLSSIVALIMYFAFENSIKNRDFSMIAGYKKEFEKNISRYERRLRVSSTIVSSMALLLNILYFLVYKTEESKHMLISTIFFLVFIISLGSSLFIVDVKFKQKSQ